MSTCECKVINCHYYTFQDDASVLWSCTLPSFPPVMWGPPFTVITAVNTLFKIHTSCFRESVWDRSSEPSFALILPCHTAHAQYIRPRSSCTIVCMASWPYFDILGTFVALADALSLMRPEQQCCSAAVLSSAFWKDVATLLTMFT